MRTNSANKLKLLECVNQRRNQWRLRWDEQKSIDSYSYEERGFDHKPSHQEIEDTIHEYYNNQTQSKIINDLIWNGRKIYLSKENQLNYQMYHNAILSGSIHYPLRIKLKDNTYMEFASNDLFEDFYSSILRHINSCLQEGWTLKDNINWEDYE